MRQLRTVPGPERMLDEDVRPLSHSRERSAFRRLQSGCAARKCLTRPEPRLASCRMGTPDAVKRLVDRLDHDRKVFLSGSYKEEQLPKAKTPHEAEALQRQTAAADRQIDALVYGLYGLTEGQVRTVERVSDDR